MKNPVRLASRALKRAIEDGNEKAVNRLLKSSKLIDVGMRKAAKFTDITPQDGEIGQYFAQIKTIFSAIYGGEQSGNYELVKYMMKVQRIEFARRLKKNPQTTPMDIVLKMRPEYLDELYKLGVTEYELVELARKSK